MDVWTGLPLQRALGGDRKDLGGDRTDPEGDGGALGVLPPAIWAPPSTENVCPPLPLHSSSSSSLLLSRLESSHIPVHEP